MYSVNYNVLIEDHNVADDLCKFLGSCLMNNVLQGQHASLSVNVVEDDDEKVDSLTLQYSINRAFEIAGIDFEVKEKIVEELLTLHIGFKQLEY